MEVVRARGCCDFLSWFVFVFIVVDCSLCL
jgi:hypothetical protein